MAITESNYIELMKNCSKFNSRMIGERRTRCPFFDQQTGTAHRPSAYAWRRSEQRYPSNDPDYVYRYPAVTWKKNPSAPPADATEMKMFLHNNPALSDAINQAQQVSVPGIPPPMGNLEAMALIGGSSESTMDGTASDRRIAQSLKREAAFDEFEDEADDMTDDGGDSDDDFGSKKKRKKEGPGRGKKKAGGGTTVGGMVNRDKERTAETVEEKRHACNKCGARYKSRPGLSYHKAHVHGDGVASSQPPSTPSAPNSAASSPAILPPPVIFSPSVDISDTCDFCDGTRLENKKTNQPEELVTCHDCGRSGHPSCLNFSENMKVSTSKFGWQCIECKSCAICGTSDNDDKLLFCDDCDRGFHLYCLRPALEKAPDDAWSCHLCLKVFGSKAAANSKK